MSLTVSSLYSHPPPTTNHILPKQNAQRTQISAALDVLETKTLGFNWDIQWGGAHDSGTSQLGGLKPGSRRDSAAPNLYWVGIFSVNNKKIVHPPFIQASFAAEPDTATAVAGLRQALAVGDLHDLISIKY
jgi:hypothetical protein